MNTLQALKTAQASFAFVDPHDIQEWNVAFKLLLIVCMTLIGWVIAYVYVLALQPGEVFGLLGKFIYKEKNKGGKIPYWKKPIGGCRVCTSFWATLVMILIAFFAPWYVFFCLVACATAVYLSNKY